MRVSLASIMVFPLLASALVELEPHSFATGNKTGICNNRSFRRYIDAVKASSSSVKAWCAAQTATIENNTFSVTSTVTVTRAAKYKVTKMRTKTERRKVTQIKGTKTVTVRRRTTATTTSGAIAVRSTGTAVNALVLDASATGDIIKRSTLLEEEGLERRAGGASTTGRPSSWARFSSRMLQKLCKCLGSPWSTVTADGTSTHTNWKTFTVFKSASSGATVGTTTVDVTVTANGTTTVTQEKTTTVTVT
ncbi:hypothetical protein H072_4864 [Dactylellina haptotyla CBS 200.50]|uniref:Uncharacterized protein n=1 Tax=Dactylellina haptotyla (strain CBS 200.50) TaxID=1284197 RepID=S8BP43_DACHA|nr:hypothetical protein H072_4864 [Dactylellina haptotyla CBS 200.50]